MVLYKTSPALGKYKLAWQSDHSSSESGDNDSGGEGHDEKMNSRPASKLSMTKTDFENLKRVSHASLVTRRLSVFTPNEIKTPDTPGSDDNKPLAERVRQALHIAIPHLVLISVLIMYIACGSLIFMNLEQPADQEWLARKSARVAENYDQIANQLAGRCKSFGETERIQIFNLLSTLSKIHENEHFAYADRTQPLNLTRELTKRWNYMESALYAMSLLSTAGYVERQAYTHWGQLVSVFYGIIGIPLTVLVAADFGRFFSDSLFLSYSWLHKQHQRISHVNFLSSAQDNILNNGVHGGPVEVKDIPSLNPSQSDAIDGSSRSNRTNSIVDHSAIITPLSLDDLDMKDRLPRRSSSRRLSTAAALSVAARAKMDAMVAQIMARTGRSKPEPKPKPKKENLPELPVWLVLISLLLLIILGAHLYQRLETVSVNFYEAIFVSFNLISSMSSPDVSQSESGIMFVFLFSILGIAMLTMAADLATTQLTELFRRVHYAGRKMRQRQYDKVPADELKAVLFSIETLRALDPTKYPITHDDVLKFIMEQKQIELEKTVIRMQQKFGADLQFVDDAEDAV